MEGIKQRRWNFWGHLEVTYLKCLIKITNQRRIKYVWLKLKNFVLYTWVGITFIKDEFAEGTQVDQGQDGKTNTYEDARNQEMTCRMLLLMMILFCFEQNTYELNPLFSLGYDIHPKNSAQYKHADLRPSLSLHLFSTQRCLIGNTDILQVFICIPGT